MTTKASRPTALVTGAARRVGKALALELGRLGYGVAVHHNGSAADASATVTELRALGVEAAAFAADLSDARFAARLIEDCNTWRGPIVCLVNNASLFLYDDLGCLTVDQWRRNLAVNLDAPVFLAQAFARQLPSGQTGNIVNLIDQRVWRPSPDFLSYGIAKAGLWAATRLLAQALAPQIRVNAIGPGPALQSIHQTPEAFRRQQAAMPLGRGTSPEEIAEALRFILGAPAMTGQMIALDGGQHLEWRMVDAGVAFEADARSMAQPLRRAPDAAAPTEGIRNIYVRDLEVETVIGVLPHERLTPQRILVSLDIAVRETGEPGSDRLADVVDYDRIVSMARRLAQEGHVKLLETLAERIAAAALPLDDRILSVRVSISKPEIYDDAKLVGIEIERTAKRN